MKQILWINNNDTDRSYMLEKTEESHTGIGQAAIEKDWGADGERVDAVNLTNGSFD